MRDEVQFRRAKGWIGILAAAFLSMLALLADISQIGNVTERQAGLQYFSTNVLGGSLTPTLLWLLLAFAYHTIAERAGAFWRSRSAVLPGALTGLVFTLGSSFYADNSFQLLVKTPLHRLFAVICFLGYTILFSNVALLLETALRRSRADGEEKGMRLRSMAGLLLLCWLPYMLLVWPGTVAPDSCDQLGQVLGTPFPGLTGSRTAAVSQLRDASVLINDMQPVLHTLLLGGVYALFWKLGCPNIGIFLFVAVQCGLMAYCLAWSIDLLRRQGVRRGIRRGLFCFYGLFPLFPIYATATAKDTAFGIALLAVVLFLAELTAFPKETLRHRRKMICFGIVLLLFLQLRHFALAIWLLTAAFFIPKAVKRLGEKRYAARLICAALLPVLISCMLNGLVYPAMKIGRGPARESESLLFQQTAAYAAAHADEITPEERAAIDGVLEFDRIAEQYNPFFADPVKNHARLSAGSEEMRAYLKTWLGQLQKHPLTYLTATIAMNIKYYDFGHSAERNGLIAYIGSKTNGADERHSVCGRPAVNPPQALTKLYGPLNRLIHLLAVVPGLSVLFSPGFYVFLLMISVALMKKYRVREGCVLLPLVLLALGLSLSPVSGSTRYAFPLMLGVPFVLVYAAARSPAIPSEDCPIGQKCDKSARSVD